MSVYVYYQVRSVNQNAYMEAQKNNEAAKTFIELASGFQVCVCVCVCVCVSVFVFVFVYV